MSIPQERHPKFYFEDATVVFSILEPTRQTLYKLYPGLLKLRSSFFQSLLSLPRPESEVNTEGTCDENPIILHVVRSEFDHLLTFLFGGHAEEEDRQDFLVSVLKLSAFFDMDHGIQHAIAELGRLPLDPFLKFQLARKYHIDKWIEPSFRAIMSRPPSSITRQEAYSMGIEYFYVLARTNTLMEEHSILKLAQPATCVAPLQCATSWAHELGDTFDFKTSLSVDEALMVLGFPNTICGDCKNATISKLGQLGFFQSVDTLKNNAAQEIIRLYRDEGKTNHLDLA